ncbi:MAG: MBL fold metallo-hydrolase [Armatimonadetes bacterium]|nr:MBL fold metallo-hydrolase [Armatimonadota bacterium]
MTFKRFFDRGLAQASYMIGCPGTGEAVIIDPNRDFDQYLQAAEAEGLRIAIVTETHIHADYLSGSRELAARTGATLYLSDEGDADWKYAFGSEPNVRLVKDGDTFGTGAVQLKVLHTPGHTPEHICFLLTDLSASPLLGEAGERSEPSEGGTPVALFSGDFIFVGDVGRPDLLENAAGIKGTAEPGARRLHQSLQRIRAYPDHLLVWPAHGAGSACGKALGGSPVSTLGYEKATNWAFQIAGEDDFVMEVLTGQPDAPPYFGRMKVQNKQGPGMLADRPDFARTGSPLPGALTLDVRPCEAFQDRHLAGSLNISVCRSFVAYAGWLIPADRPVSLIAASEQDARYARRELSLIGVDNVVSWSGPDAIESASSRQLASADHTDSGHLSPDAVRLDVRAAAEFEEGHYPGAVNIHYGRLPALAGSLPKDRRIEVYCHAGERSAVAVSVLASMGFTDVAHIRDGYVGMVDRGLVPAG